MEQSSGTISGNNSADPKGASERVVIPSASERVYLGIMRDLEEHRMVPGQRLIESELAGRFGVGRNAVREALQRLAVRGVVDLTPNRSPAIRLLDLAETLEVLDLAAVMTGFAAKAAALRYDDAKDGEALKAALIHLREASSARGHGDFSKARRQFYRSLLSIGGNRELQRMFPAIGMHVIYSQYRSPHLDEIRLADYQSIHAAIIANDPKKAEEAGIGHVLNVRSIVIEQVKSRREY